MRGSPCAAPAPIGFAFFGHLRQDLAYASRGLKRSPGFTAIVVVTLALGLGLNAAMFSLLDRLFFQAPHGIAAPGEIRRLYTEFSRPREPGGRTAFPWFTYPAFRAIVAAEDASLQIAAFTQPDSTGMQVGGVTLPVRRSFVAADYFGTLRVRPQLGRFFTGDEIRIEAPTAVAVVSDALWRRVYGGDRAVLGKTISIEFRSSTNIGLAIEARSYAIVGVAPKDFTGLDTDAADVWLPGNARGSFASGATPWYETNNSLFSVVARLPTAGLEQQVVAKATAAFRRVHVRYAEYDSTARVLAGPVLSALGPAHRPQELSISMRLSGVAFIVLLIACANVANLLLVRATGRRREIAVRRALGVSGPRLCAQLLTESLLLAAFGGAAAMLFAVWAGTALRRLLLPNINWADGAVDLRTIAFVCIASLFAGVLAGLAPALQATRADVIGWLKAGAREGTYQRSTLRSALLVAQAALSVVLLVGAGLFVRSLSTVQGLDLGYDVEHALFIQPVFATPGDHTKEFAAAIPQVADRLRAVSGVEAIGYGSMAPMRGVSFGFVFLPGRDSLPPSGAVEVDPMLGAWPSWIAVSPGFFRASGMRLIAGRDFDEADRAGGTGAVVVNEAMARAYWPGESALGKCLIRGKRTNPCSTVVGIVGNVHRMRVVETPGSHYYVPLDPASLGSTPAALVVRTTSRNVAAVSQVATQELKNLLPGTTTPWIRTMSQTLESQYRPWRLGATLFTAFGALALVVAAIGVYSVVAYGVSQRTHEMGVRVALGAQPYDVLRLVLGEGERIVALGVALGVVIALVLGRLVASLLYGVTARDPLVMITAAAVLLTVGLVASVLPGWRATRVDPVAALRAE